MRPAQVSLNGTTRSLEPLPNTRTSRWSRSTSSMFKPVSSLTQWGQVAATSDAFARASVTDYWKFLIGHPPTPEESAEFVTVWQAFKAAHSFRIKPMLHDLIRTEAYGAP